MSRKRQRTLFGWYEMNECNYNIQTLVVAADTDIDDLDGSWFTSLAKAKKAALAHWRRQANIAVSALKHIRTIRKSQYETA